MVKKMGENWKITLKNNQKDAKNSQKQQITTAMIRISTVSQKKVLKIRRNNGEEKKSGREREREKLKQWLVVIIIAIEPEHFPSWIKFEERMIKNIAAKFTCIVSNGSAGRVSMPMPVHRVSNQCHNFGRKIIASICFDWPIFECGKSPCSFLLAERWKRTPLPMPNGGQAAWRLPWESRRWSSGPKLTITGPSVGARRAKKTPHLVRCSKNQNSWPPAPPQNEHFLFTMLGGGVSLHFLESRSSFLQLETITKKSDPATHESHKKAAKKGQNKFCTKTVSFAHPPRSGTSWLKPSQ